MSWSRRTSSKAPSPQHRSRTGSRRAWPAPPGRRRGVPVADGGDGTLEAALSAGYRRVPVRAEGPTGEAVDTAYAERDGVAVVELADVSGLGRLPGGRLAAAPPRATAPDR